MTTAAALTVNPGSVVTNKWVKSISGSGFKAGEAVLVVVEKAVKGEDFVFAGATANKQGAFYIKGTKKRGRAVKAIKPGAYTLRATGVSGSMATAPLQIIKPPKPKAPAPPVPAATVVVNPGSVVSNKWVKSISGSGFKPGETVLIVLQKAIKGEDFIFAGAMANKQGTFRVTGTKKRGRALKAISPGLYTLKASGTSGSVAVTPLYIEKPPKPKPAPKK